jgi:predicted peptidase
MQAQQFRKTVSREVLLDYFLYLPQGYDGVQDFPLLLFLHGGGERGSDLQMLKANGIPRLIAEGQHFPFVIAAPQCPLPYRWPDQIESLAALVEELASTYRIDRRRIYLTGLSQGGCGTWHLGMRYAHLFAALLPVCGYRPYTYGYKEKSLPLRDMPIWTFHGVSDEIVDVSETDKLVEGLREHGSAIRYTRMEGVNHSGCWERVYAMPEIYEWLLQQSRSGA